MLRQKFQSDIRALMRMGSAEPCGSAAQAANVLISTDGKVYLADYGVVAPVEHVTGSSSNGGPERERVRRRHAAVVSTFTGTPAWMAPEVGWGVVPADGACNMHKAPGCWLKTDVAGVTL